jgi:uncharacterized protein with von Willebrand factor type A (vWA) domain
MNYPSRTAQSTLEREPEPEPEIHGGEPTFGVTTIELDVPAVAAAMSQRLHAAGVPVTPERAVTFAQALTLVSPLSRSYLYCTARAIFVSSRTQLPTFDQAFASVFGSSLDTGEECAQNAGAVEDRRQAQDAEHVL